MTFIDWERKRAFVEPVDGGGLAKWSSGTFMGLSHALIRATRAVLLGTGPVAPPTRRADARTQVWRELYPSGRRGCCVQVVSG
ncbi:hypothetical protein EAO73_12095 [Streptomyces sp. col6]|nr:hypothetical protein EAO73_12095 [Streptomyces sp. col6]